MSKRLAWAKSPLFRFMAAAVAGVLCLGYAISLIGPLSSRGRLQRQLRNLQFEREQQDTLYPFYVDLERMDRVDDWESLKLPEAQAMAQSEVPLLPEHLEVIAEAHGFVMGTPEVRVTTAKRFARGIGVMMPISGSFDDLGGLLHDLVRLPALDHFSELRIIHLMPDDEIEIEFVLGLAQRAIELNRGQP